MLLEKIEAVTVCVNYADFLDVALRWNKHLFDRWIVVTNPADKETRAVCHRHGVQVLLTAENEETFPKGQYVERALKMLSSDGWRLHIDADIVLPQRFRNFLQMARLDRRNIYGVDRLMIHGYDQWQRLLQSNYLHDGMHAYHQLTHFLPGTEVGGRWVGEDVGYVPIGFFQLWHSSEDQYHGVRSKPYPANHNDACRTDVQFALQWDRRQRELLSEFLAIHLDSGRCQNGANWKGRTTLRFGPLRDYADSAFVS